MIPVEFLLTEGKANEKKVLLKMAQTGVTYIHFSWRPLAIAQRPSRSVETKSS